MNRALPQVAALSLAAIFVFLCAAELAETTIVSFAYSVVTITALLYTCSRVFARAGRHGSMEDSSDMPVLLTAALGLGIFVLNEIYLFAYIYLLQGGAEDITIANISRNTAYLFFIAAILFLLPKAGRAAKNAISAASAAAILFVFAGVVAATPPMLYYSALTVIVLNAIAAVWLFIAGGREAKAFSAALLFVALLDFLGRLALIYQLNQLLRDIVLSLYPAAYLLLGTALLRLSPPQPASREVAPVNE